MGDDMGNLPAKVETVGCHQPGLQAGLTPSSYSDMLLHKEHPQRAVVKSMPFQEVYAVTITKS